MKNKYVIATQAEDAEQFQTSQNWVFDTALPFWASAGVDRVSGGFVEHLALDGKDGGAPFKRVRAQARQIYVFSHAALLGWEEGRSIADYGWRFLNQHGRREDGAWIRRMGRSGGVLDATCDAYDMAFVLFAHAWYYRLTGDPAVIESALETVDLLDRLLADPAGRGWLAAEGSEGLREQNPHMHLVEAALELAQITGLSRFGSIVEHATDLLEKHFVHPETGLLYEFFEADWSLSQNPAVAVAEPGHMLEWSWILRRATRLLGMDFSNLADRLYHRALEIGEREHGFIIDQVDRQGHQRLTSCRSWPQTEALKAHLAAYEAGDSSAWAKAMRCARNLHRHYLCVEPNGTWIDQLDSCLRPSIDKIPSTTFYHIFLAFSEMRRLQPMLSGDTPPAM